MHVKVRVSTSVVLALSFLFVSTAQAAEPDNLPESVSTASRALQASETTGTAYANSGSSWSLSSSVDYSASASTGASTAQWIQINTPMGKITTGSTIILSWSAGGITGPLEIYLVSATTGDITTITSSIDLGTGVYSYKWIVTAALDTYYLEGNAQTYPSLVYASNFIVSSHSDSSCPANKQGADPIGAGGSATAASQSVKPSRGSTFNSGSDRIVVPEASFWRIGALAVHFL